MFAPLVLGCTTIVCAATAYEPVWTFLYRAVRTKPPEICEKSQAKLVNRGGKKSSWITWDKHREENRASDANQLRKGNREEALCKVTSRWVLKARKTKWSSPSKQPGEGSSSGKGCYQEWRAYEGMYVLKPQGGKDIFRGGGLILCDL